jgi:DMSO/TMAO reductase YedYZ molybdopterin-dependent catalytic subunit
VEQNSPARWMGPAAGIVATGVALGVAQLAAALAGPRSAPLVAVGDLVIDRVPGAVRQWAIATLGRHDKTALLAGTAVLLAVCGALVGWLGARRLRYGMAGAALFAAVGLTAALTRPGARAAYALPSLAGAVAAVATLAYLLHRAGVHLAWARPAWMRAGHGEIDGVEPAPGTREARRRFLLGSSMLAASAALAGLAGRQLGERRTVATARDAIVLPSPSEPAAAPPAAADLRVPGLTPFVTSDARFYRIDTASTVPQIAPDDWRLRIHGQVARPLTLTYEQLLTRPMIERYVTLACVSNEVGGDLIGNARWLGVRIKDLLVEAGPLAGADQVVGRSIDGFTTGTPTKVLLDGRDAMLAVGMNGEPLPIEHGFPVRMVVPGLYGYVSATKWLTELELTSFADYSAYWVSRGWAARGPIKTESRIDTPRNGATIRRAEVIVAGVAWAQHRGISRVEVRVDGGAWQPATLAAVPSVDTWRQWSWTWRTTPGKHRLTVRATDNGGVTQTERQTPPAPDGASGWHTITVSVG